MQNEITSDFLKEIDHICSLLNESGTQHWWLKPEINERFYKNGFYILPATYYAPLPSPCDIRKIDFEKEYYPLDQLNYSKDICNDWLENVIKYKAELIEAVQTDSKGFGYDWENDQFGGLDAITYYGLIRKAAPKRIIEIGCGNSSLIAAMALLENGDGELTLIEPHPTATLETLKGHYSLVNSKIQDVDLTIFDQLQAGDVLFVDSSHCAYIQSDVHQEIFNIIPRLRPGVLVHFHDIFYPFEYPSTWMHAGWRWNEQYLLYAFLMMNPRIRVILPNHAVVRQPEIYAENTVKDTNFAILRGHSLWVEILSP